VVTVPACDIAENPYWKRDVRRSYPKLSVVTQSDVVGLLSVGSAAAPKEDVLKIGDAGKTQLVEVKEEGEKGLSAYFEKNQGVFAGVLGKDGLPPTPTSRHPQGKRYALIQPEEQTYGDGYVQCGDCRSRNDIANGCTATRAGLSYKLGYSDDFHKEFCVYSDKMFSSLTLEGRAFDDDNLYRGRSQFHSNAPALSNMQALIQPHISHLPFANIT
jgi:hypothetical protein